MVTIVQMSPIENWTARQIGLPGGENLSLQALRAYQLDRLNATLAHAVVNSPFYGHRLQSCGPLRKLEELNRLPFTTAAHLSGQGLQMLAVSQSKIDRIVTLRSSGTTGQAKRLYFTRADLRRTQDFFRCGMSQVLQPGSRVLVLLPGDLPDSQGRLLAEALETVDVECEIYGLLNKPGHAASLLVKEPFDCVVGIPTQVLALVRHPMAADVPRGRIGGVFLTSDYVPSALVQDIRRIWGCPAFNHYGMTELGLTGGVECQALSGYHLRETDFYFEVIDPDSGKGLPAGETGEVVVTSLQRTGMPLIRYRTGDLARFIDTPCPCGSSLPRLSKLQGRLAGQIDIGGPLKLSMSDLDEALFTISGLLNYRVRLYTPASGKKALQLTLETLPGRERQTRDTINRRLPAIPALHEAAATGALVLLPAQLAEAPFSASARTKRMIEISEKEHPCLETAHH